MNTHICRIPVVFFLLGTLSFAQVPGQLNYQGRILDGTNLYNGTAPLVLRIYNDALAGDLLLEDSNTVTFSDGFYSTWLGDNITTGSWVGALSETNLHIEISVDGTTLAPREPISSVLYAQMAASVPTGAITSAMLADGVVTMNKLASNAVTGAHIADGSISNVDLAAGFVTGETVEDGSLEGVDVDADTFSNIFWKVDGNAGTTAGTHFLGTTDEEPLELRVHGIRVMSLAPTDVGTPNIIGGSASNYVTADARGATIAGGGYGLEPNRASDDMGTIGGGLGNVVGDPAPSDEDFATISGGQGNLAAKEYAVVGGGYTNRVTGTSGVIGGGRANTANDTGNVIGGGRENTTSDDYSTIGGGYQNTAAGDFAGGGSTVAGGIGNAASRSFSTVSGGTNNTASGSASTVGGGRGNKAGGSESFVGGGLRNQATLSSATVAGGKDNTASGGYAAILGGETNNALGFYSVIGGGYRNIAEGSHAVIAGGNANMAEDQYAAVGGGINNWALGESSVVAGGDQNAAKALASAVLGGEQNMATGHYAAVVGGIRNRAEGVSSFTGGGQTNWVSGDRSAILGGAGNDLDGDDAVIGGGQDNYINLDGTWSVIAGGRDNYVTAPYATIGGGGSNRVTQVGSTIAGGGGWDALFSVYVPNVINGQFGFIGGGGRNAINPDNAVGVGDYCVISGGYLNRVATNAGHYSTIAGGSMNFVNRASYGTIGGGLSNTVLGSYATVPGGRNNAADGMYSFAAGYSAHAEHNGTFVWADSQGSSFTSTTNDQFLIRAQNGVGINTVEPLADLHVLGDSSLAWCMLAPDQAINGGNSRLWLAEDHDGTLGMYFEYNGDADQLSLYGKSTINTYGPHLLINRNSGRMGIGTTNITADYQLSVGGAIRCEEVVVESGWADFVFEPDYRLSTLEEVETHINEHKRLPDMPSAEDVQKHGVKVGEIESRLLQKVEELTLYLIRQEKEIKALRDEVASLRGEMDCE